MVSFYINILGLSSLFVISLVPLVSAQNKELAAQPIEKSAALPNLLRFSSPEYHITEELRRLTPAAFYTHPDFGRQYPHMPCQNCIERIDKRDAFSTEYYYTGTNGKHFVRQQSYFPMHYQDKHGNWRRISHYLTKNTNNTAFDEYQSLERPVPITLTLQGAETKLAFQLHEGMIAVGKGTRIFAGNRSGEKKLLAEPLSSTTHTAGDEGVLIQNRFAGIDYELIFKSGSIKANYHLKQRPEIPVGYEYYIIEEIWDLPYGFQLVTLSGTGDWVNGIFTGDLQISDQNAAEALRIERPWVYDNARPRVFARQHYTQSPQSGYQFERIQGYENRWRIRTIVRADWLSDPARSYPVVIDPLLDVRSREMPADQLPKGSLYKSPNPDSAHCKITPFSRSAACTHRMTCPTPPKVTITRMYSEMTYKTFGEKPWGGPWTVNYGGYLMGTAGCDAANVLGTYDSIQPGTSLPYVEINNFISFVGSGWLYPPCIPAPQCNSYNQEFTCRLQRCFTPGSGCTIDALQMTRWYMLIEGRMLELTFALPQNKEICLGDTIALVADGEWGVPDILPLRDTLAANREYQDYIWKPNQPGQRMHWIQDTTADSVVGKTVFVKPTAPGVYKYTVRLWDKCDTLFYDADVSFTVKPSPEKPVLVSDTVCVGKPLVLIALPPGGGSTTGYTYRWEKPDGSIELTKNLVINAAQATDSGLYKCQIIFQGCSSAVSTIRAGVFPPPPKPVLSAGTTCEGGDLQLRLDPPAGFRYPDSTRYFWSSTSGFGSNERNPILRNVTTANNGLYIAYVEYPAGCLSPIESLTVTVVPNRLLPPVCTNNSPLCEGDGQSLTLNATADTAGTGIGYFWTGPNGFTSTLQNPIIPNPTLSDSGLYSCVLVTPQCSSGVGLTRVVIKATPQRPTARNTSPVCPGSTFWLYADTIPNAAYFWTGPDNFSSTEQNPRILSAVPENGGDYQVVTIADGCTSAVATTTATVYPRPARPAIPADPVVCARRNGLVLDPGNYPAGTQFFWTGPNGFRDTTSAVLRIPDFDADDVGEYSVFVVVNGCPSDVAKATVNYAEPPPEPIGTHNSPLCQGQTLLLIGSLPDGTAGADSAIYLWKGPNNLTATGQTLTIPNAGPEQAGIYYVAVVIRGCTSEFVPAPPVEILYAPRPKFAGIQYCDTTAITYRNLTADSIIAAELFPNINDLNQSLPLGLNYNDSLRVFYAPGWHTAMLRVTFANGCQSTDTQSVYVRPRPVKAYFESTPDSGTCYECILLVNVSAVDFRNLSFPSDSLALEWDFGDGTGSTLERPSKVWNRTGRFDVNLFVRSPEGCRDTFMRPYAVEDEGLWIPNAFTPNGDGENEKFVLKGVNIDSIYTEIFDRWGDRIWDNKGQRNNFWDGTNQRTNMMCPEGVYVYRATARGRLSRRLLPQRVGMVTLIR